MVSTIKNHGYTNPAKRLYDIFNTIMTKQRLIAEHHEPTIYGLARLLGLGSRMSFVDVIGQLFSIIHSYEQFVKRSETMRKDQKNMHLDQLQDVKAILVQSDNWQRLGSGLDKNFIRNLQWAAGEMNHHWDEYGIKEEDLASLQSETEELINKIVNSDLDIQLMSVLTSGLNGVRQAILEYRIHGAEGLRQTLDKIIADLARHREEFEAESTKTETQEFIKDYLKIIQILDRLVSTGLKIKQIASPLVGFLPMLNSGEWSVIGKLRFTSPTLRHIRI